jgi:hypothetical protein
MKRPDDYRMNKPGHGSNPGAPEETSPFSLPPVTAGYPFDEREKAAIERVLRENGQERTQDHEAE